MVRFLLYVGSGYAGARAIEAAVYKIPIGLTLRFPFTSVAKIRDMYIAAKAAAVPAPAAAAVPAPITQTPPAPLSGWGATTSPHHRRRRRTRRQIQQRTQSMMTAPGAQAQQALWLRRQQRAA